MADEYEIHRNKRPDKTYISRSLAFKRQDDRRIRIASKVIDSSETHTFAVEHGEHVIRVTDGGRQEIIAKFYEDNRGVYVLTLQRFTTETGVPHQTHFCSSVKKFHGCLNSSRTCDSSSSPVTSVSMSLTGN
jgi:hypothetical protein